MWLWLYCFVFLMGEPRNLLWLSMATWTWQAIAAQRPAAEPAARADGKPAAIVTV